MGGLGFRYQVLVVGVGDSSQLKAHSSRLTAHSSKAHRSLLKAHGFLMEKNFLNISYLNALKIKTVLLIAAFWTLTDLVMVVLREDSELLSSSLWLRSAFIFLISIAMAYLFVYGLKRKFRSKKSIR